MVSVNGLSPQEIGQLVTNAGIAKSHLSWSDLMVRSFLGGVFISLGALVDLIIISGSPGLRTSNPSLATMIAGFTFPLGFVLVTLTNMELCTSNMFVMPYTTLQRRTTLYDLGRNWVMSYLFNIIGCLFVAGFLGWWSAVLSTDVQTTYAVTQANARVNVGWSVNLLRGVGCNFLVALAFFMSLGSVEFVSKVFTIWIPVWSFVIAGYQHSIANYFSIPMGMFYGGAEFSVGRFIYQSIIPVTLGNIIGGALLGSVPFWFLYGRGPVVNIQTGQPLGEPKSEKGTESSDETAGDGGPASMNGSHRRYNRDGIV